jgi:ABC-type dipeptide/oligopeptide/nickel transport system ATPase subunit
MVERYSKIDYDQLSEFDQKISELILNGELIKADSLLRTKGDINERVSQYKKHEAINAKEREELSQRQEQLEQSEALAIQERDDLANDCYCKFEIFKMQHWNDSAAYYLELRASLDTINAEWLNEAGLFLYNYIANYEYKCNSVIDDMPKECSVADITKMFYAVGFGSVPSWLKPYNVLSNGEKMRCDLARALLTNDLVVFDEFTSVIDRQVAETACIAIEKAIKRTNKQFIAISCHFDILNWLQPDWIFNTDTMTMDFRSAHELKNNIMSKNVISASGRNLGVITI